MNKLYSVHDHWTDINKKNDVDIESIDGVITGIKVNGEDYGGGSSDFTTAKVTFIADEANTVGDWDGPFIINEPNIGECVSYGTGTIDTPNIELTIVLYKGVASTSIGDTINEVVSTSGNIERIDKTRYKITGDCTIHYIGRGIA